ncbi:MAG TPA: GGDEF domain-containing protein [Sulfurovum sp.]|nr:GGDEF domain-containing protein [Sulfurovum sp.]
MKNASLLKKMSTSLKRNEFLYQNKIHLIQLFNLVALLFLLPLAVQAFVLQNYISAFPLLLASLFVLFNYYYLEKSKNEIFASHLLSSIFFVLMIYLLHSGGVNGTGPLWISALPLIVFFVLGLEKGFYYISFFLILAFIILFVPAELPFKSQYPHDFKVRVILSFLLITFLSAMYEYNNAKSLYAMRILKEELEYSSTRDHLTSLYNRRGYEKYIQSIENPKGIILMCDMDLFKKVKDNYGHEAGDFVLQEVAKKIQSILRKDDLGVRWGGEEFFIFLPHTSLEEGALVAEKIRTSVESLSLIYNGHPIESTLSIGVEEVNDTLSLIVGISHADNAMYQAKKAGRNSTVIYSA